LVIDELLDRGYFSGGLFHLICFHFSLYQRSDNFPNS
jgi:hypothetical protein